MWYYYTNNLEYGPVAESALAELLAKGVITAQTLIRDADQREWQTLEESELTASIEVPKDNPKVWQTCAFSGERRKRKEMARVNGFWVAKAHRDEAAAFTSKGGWLPTKQSGCRAQGCVDFGHLLKRSVELLMSSSMILAFLVFVVLGPGGERLWLLSDRGDGSLGLAQTAVHVGLLALVSVHILQALSRSIRNGTSGIEVAVDFDLLPAAWAKMFVLFLPLMLPVRIGMMLQVLSPFQLMIGIVATAFIGAKFAFAIVATVERQLSPIPALLFSQKLTAGATILWAAAFLALFIAPDIVASNNPAYALDHRLTFYLFRTLAFLSLIPLFVCYQELEARHLERQEQSSAPHLTT